MIVTSHEVPGVMRKIAPVPPGRLNGSRPRCIGGITDQVHLLLSLPTTVPIAKAIQLIKAGSSAWIHPRHFMPGYYQPVPPGQKPFAHRRSLIKLALMGPQPWAESSSPAEGQKHPKLILVRFRSDLVTGSIELLACQQP